MRLSGYNTSSDIALFKALEKIKVIRILLSICPYIVPSKREKVNVLYSYSKHAVAKIMNKDK